MPAATWRTGYVEVRRREYARVSREAMTEGASF
jgi:hypothetical protein